MVAVVALLKHLLLFGMPRAALPIAAISLWGLNAGLRFGQMAYNNLAGPQDGEDATVKRFYSDETKKSVTAFKIHILVKRGREVGPGDYYYLSFNDMGLRRRWQAHPFVVSWWDDSMNASCLDFLVEPQAGITADLISKKCIRGVTLDGPYGKDIHLQDYETVILVARGIGIVGVLPYVRHMIYRRSSTSKNLEEYRRGLITRKIDLYWDMEDNSQQDWLEEWIKALKGRDAEKLILTFTCFYPSKKSKPPPILQESGKPPDEHWRFVYEKEALPIINDLMLKRIARSPGKTKVVVCGAASFSKDIRTYVIDAMDSYSDIEFAEVEYQPRGSHGYNIHSRVGSLKTDMDMEMGVTDEMPRQKQLLTKSNPGRTLGPSKARPTGSRNTTTRMKTVPEEEEEEEEEVSDVSSSAGAGVAGREFV
ncbi:hypothetical protein NA56DRAFT_658055 [Hyaloscypha hepaticicola]|uniref:Ferric reductase NAD binding domain-containing protein n=1 Tax=Hyaloscypha hepaticicola TaxID=2082293 RepID=A0A2J6Q8V5_9HELO|nr:hypothetical protein NA56DRAFT_658055 [Hyaloscypha hepaticicola]